MYYYTARDITKITQPNINMRISSIANRIRLMAIGIPEAWKQWKTKEGPIQDQGQAERIRSKVVDKEIKKPGLFLRDLGRVIDYIGAMSDPKKHGIIQDLTKFRNDFRPERDTQKYPTLTKNFQEDMIDSASNLENNAPLIEMLRKLFMEEYETGTPIKRQLKAISEAIRSMAVTAMDESQRHQLYEVWRNTKHDPEKFIETIRKDVKEWLREPYMMIPLSKALERVTGNKVTLNQIIRPVVKKPEPPKLEEKPGAPKPGDAPVLS